jgi:ATP-binding cassette subfamily B protein
VFLFSDSITNNIGFSLDDPAGEMRRVQDAAMVAHVHDNIVAFNQGYDTLLGERGITLSGGQKQRVSIARAVVREPRILVFDDPLSAVDTATEAAILDALDKVMEGRTTVIISHRISAVQGADAIIVRRAVIGGAADPVEGAVHPARRTVAWLIRRSARPHPLLA